MVNGYLRGEGMKLEIMSGQQDINLNNKFTDLLAQNGIYIDDVEQKHFMIFPERYIFHPKKLYKTIRQKVREHIENNIDFFILTYSDHVLNAVRVEIKNHNFDGAKCHQFLNNGEDVCADITKNGRLTIWIDDVFDVWENALMELL